METNLSRLLNFLPALVLVGLMMGCGGNTASDNKSPKGEGKKDLKAKPENNSSPGEGNQSVPPKPENNSSLDDGKATTDTANKPKATKFTPEMVKAAMKAMTNQLPSNGETKQERAKMVELALTPERIEAQTKMLNEKISGGKIDFGGVIVDEITVEALTEALVKSLGSARKKALASKSEYRSRQLVKALLVYEGDNDGKFPTSDKWCDAILRDAGTLAAFYSPQHPDTTKLEVALPNLGQRNDDSKVAPQATKKGADASKPAPLPEGKRVSHYAFNKVMSGKYNDDPEMVLVFECDLGWNGIGGLADALKYMEKHKLEKIAVATADGAGRSATKEELKKLKWEISP